MSAVPFPPNPSEPRDPSAHALLSFPTEIDFSNAGDMLGHVMSKARPGDGPWVRVLVLDFTATDFMDSQGVRLIDDARRLLRPATRVHVVVRPDGVASRVLEVTGLRRDVPVYDNLPEALAA
ncbi:STAS domain-containing protein [Streptomyces fungicidicus]|uniref:STAS domain-containing protein n=1 Tax=Streptomyces fungicidicus TaxID=68203 RepID=UPI0037B36DC6